MPRPPPPAAALLALLRRLPTALPNAVVLGADARTRALELTRASRRTTRRWWRTIAAGTRARPRLRPPSRNDLLEAGARIPSPARRERATLLVVRYGRAGDPDAAAAAEVADIIARRLAPLGVATVPLSITRLPCAQTSWEVERLAGIVEARAEALGRQAAASGVGRVACYASGLAAAGVLRAAARRPTLFAALALRSVAFESLGQPLRLARAPTLLLVGAYEQPAVDFHRLAALDMGARASLKVLPRGTRALADGDARYAAASAVSAWLIDHLSAGEPRPVRAKWTARTLYRSWIGRYQAAPRRVEPAGTAVR